jgi:anti-anti-sigma factor
VKLVSASLRGNATILVLAVEGDFDRTIDRAGREELKVLLEENRGKDIILNISGLKHIDSLGISLLIQMKRDVEALGNSFLLCAPGVQVKKILRMAGSYGYFGIHDDEGSAIDSLTTSPCELCGAPEEWSISMEDRERMMQESFY